ncbi:sigma-70 family RNA polymerase sigma factor [Bacillus sp. FJAT-45066]|uniref:sigma-70 family RNA polymerase sigma factor n=1 Tax=Bacillus sp. FJAT-45066 TaxID=2011010 RepID=UPI000BB8319B|nr:sigma-70 family RNA polymerase sigma factor [Bacillus sp. FJAT-45066]
MGEFSEEEKIELVEKAMAQYGEAIKRLLFTYVRDHAVVDDLFQEVFIKVYYQLDSFRGDSELKTWIYRIAINKSKDYLRSFSTRLKNLVKLQSSFVAEQAADAEMLVMEGESQSEIGALVLQLPIKYREVLILFYYKDFTVEEISDILHMNKNTIKTRLNRGRSRLKDLMVERGYDDDRLFR